MKINFILNVKDVDQLNYYCYCPIFMRLKILYLFNVIKEIITINKYSYIFQNFLSLLIIKMNVQSIFQRGLTKVIYLQKNY